MKPFNREKFLLYLLGGIFAFQAGLFAVGFSLCFNFGGLKACPELGTRYENTFNVMIATTLALLTGSALKGLPQRSRKTELTDKGKPQRRELRMPDQAKSKSS